MCYICKGNHLAKDCPEAGGDGRPIEQKGAEKASDKGHRKGQEKGKGKADSKGEGGGKDARHAAEDLRRFKHEDRIDIAPEDLDPGFNLKQHLIGPGGENLKHISES